MEKPAPAYSGWQGQHPPPQQPPYQQHDSGYYPPHHQQQPQGQPQMVHVQRPPEKEDNSGWLIPCAWLLRSMLLLSMLVFLSTL
ncbi:hypothetical protein ONZ45_g6489 [Pleurotus djamor]|nr:hypothetical protein ONZ45_g6489 [Pleurotus djamor]